jgi:hypothetical protein
MPVWYVRHTTVARVRPGDLARRVGRARAGTLSAAAAWLLPQGYRGVTGWHERCSGAIHPNLGPPFSLSVPQLTPRLRHDLAAALTYVASRPFHWIWLRLQRAVDLLHRKTV